MEYDKVPGPAGAVPASTQHEQAPIGSGAGHLRVKGDSVDTTALAQPLTLPFSKRVAKNRFLKAPMTERLCHWNKDGEPINARGVPSPELINLYKRWGEGEIGIIYDFRLNDDCPFDSTAQTKPLQTMIQYDALEAYGNPILCDNHDGRLEKYREMCNAAKAHGSLFVCQLSHPGRQGGKALNPNPVSASDVHLKIKWAGNEFAPPRPLAIDEIKQMVKAWGETAYLCSQAGFDGVQVHCAHGYLLAQFLSPSTNLRTDEYGGSLENRARIVFEIIDEIRRRVPDPSFIVCVKLNSVEFQDKGTTPEDSQWLCTQLERARVDFVDLSGGTFEARAFHHRKESTKAREAYFLEFADLIRPNLKTTKVYVTGGFRTANGMVGAVKGGSCDGIGLGRPLSAEPLLCKNILSGKVTGAIDNVVPLPLNTQASGTQLYQVGHGHQYTSDFSVEEEVRRWVEASEKETERKISILPKVDSSGYPAFRAQVGFDYLK